MDQTPDKNYSDEGLGESRRDVGTALSAANPQPSEGLPGSSLQSLSRASCKERPMLFSGPMVRAILDGRKTQTRRIVKPQPVVEMNANVSGKVFLWKDQVNSLFVPGFWQDEMRRLCPYGKPGDRLWVRETWELSQVTYGDESDWDNYDGPIPKERLPWCCVQYRADGNHMGEEKWKPSIHMPRWASRITLEVVSVRVERLQWISEADARDEGCVIPTNRIVPGTPFEYITRGKGQLCRGIYGVYAELWESINGPGSWDANPWVWVVEFRRVRDRSEKPGPHSDAGGLVADSPTP